MVDKKHLDKIKNMVSEDHLKLDEAMASHTTFKIGGPADIYITPDREELISVLEYCRENGIPTTIVGNGSNILVSDKGIRGVVLVLTSPMADISVDGDTIRAEAGALLGRVASAAAEAGLTGMEFAAGIPGSMGGAVLMNAGAYDGEMKDILSTVTLLSPDGEVLEFPASDLGLSYRHSFMMETGDIILSATIRLKPGDKEEIRSKMQELNQRRIDKQPLTFPSAGSTFKRPAGYFAGKLIQDSGLSGYRVGGACVSEKHCGFVINDNNATAKDVLKLMNDVMDIVKERQGVTLEPEVRYLGEIDL